MAERGMEPFGYQRRFANELSPHPESECIYAPRKGSKALVSHNDIIVGKSRQIGVSELLTDYARYHVEQGRRVLVISKNQDLSVDFLKRSELRYAAGKVKANETQVELANGGIIRALPATEDAGRGFTADLVIVDEAAFHPWAQQNYRAYRPTMADGGQLIIVSTGNGAAGFFHDFYRAAEAGENGFAWFFFGADERPRPEGWYERERVAYAGLPGDFTRENPRQPDEMFMAHSGLVYGLDPDDGVAIFEKRRNLTAAPCDWQACKWRVAGADPGGSDPTAVLAVGVTSDTRLHVYGEWVHKAAVGAEEISQDWMIPHGKAPLDFEVVDPSQRALIETLRAMGWNVYPANNDKGARIALLKMLLKSGRLTIDPRCKQLVRELNSYWWKERRAMTSGGNAWETVTPADHHADCLDALGYICLAVLQGLPGAQSEVKVEWR